MKRLTLYLLLTMFAPCIAIAETAADPAVIALDNVDASQWSQPATLSVPDLNYTAKALPDNEAITFTQKLSPGWNLGNTFDAYNDNPWFTDELEYETIWCGAFTTPELIAQIKAAGFNAIRIPVSWHNHVSGENHQISEKWLNRVRQVVDHALALDMYVILNTHHDIDKGFIYPDEAHAASSQHYLRCIWRQLAERFAAYDEHLIMESMNEPRLAGTSYEWNFSSDSEECIQAARCINAYNQLFVDTVRQTGGNNATRYLMVPGYAAAPAGVTNPYFVVPTDSAKDRLLLSVHAYSPYGFALQAANQTGSTDEFDIKGLSSVGDIQVIMRSLYETYVSKGIPVVMGEFGSRDKHNPQARVDHAAYTVALARAHGIPCFWWDNNAAAKDVSASENFRLIDRNTFSWSGADIVRAIMLNAQ